MALWVGACCPVFVLIVVVFLCCWTKDKPKGNRKLQTLFIHRFSEISHQSLPPLLLVSDMFIICHMKEYHKEAGSSPASSLFFHSESSLGSSNVKLH